MLEPFYFALGLVNSGFLIFIFVIRKNHLDLLQRIGWVYFLISDSSHLCDFSCPTGA
jgi:hypothetical protein